MKINRIELMNIGSYEGLNEFNIESQNDKGRIVVVGGKNGAGKTTLFTSIKLCLYGCKESGYQAINAFYKKNIKRLVNDKAKIENKANAHVLLDISILNGQDWDRYILKRMWDLEGSNFETFEVQKNGMILSSDEIVDFENFLLNLIPPELFELYFFDGEQIADFFLQDENNEKIKDAFLTICGYDTFEIIYKNFKRVSKANSGNDNALAQFFEVEDRLYLTEKELKENKKNLQMIEAEIETQEGNLSSLERNYITSGGVSIEEWNKKFLELKNEERIRDEKNAWVKNATNEMIPYIILNRELNLLLEKMISEQEVEKNLLLKESIVSILPQVLKSVQEKHSEFSQQLQEEVLDGLLKQLKKAESSDTPILNLSKMEYKQLTATISKLLEYDKNQIIEARTVIKNSIQRSQEIREEIDRTNIDGIETYLKEKDSLFTMIKELMVSKETLLHKQNELEEEVEKVKAAYKRAEKDLEKQLKTQSVSNLTTKAILFLETLKKRLFESEIQKVQQMFMEKMVQLMRKEQFIDKIEIDDEFRVHVYKRVKLDCKGVCEKILQITPEKYQEEYGAVHCADILKITSCATLDEFVRKYKYSNKIFDVMLEFDKATMSKGEKQVFIMALYWSMVQLSNKEIPFIIDTPFARIDTEHREHITEYFFKDLKGQVFIFSTDEEITPKHMNVIGDDLAAKFLIENMDNTKTEIKANTYFGEEQ